MGLEERQETDTTQFFLEKKEGNEIIENNEENFFSDIKFNLISKKTISVIGENDNIPDTIFDNYYVKAKLLSKGNYPHAICLDKNVEYTPVPGSIHYPMEKYYLKLHSLKGQFDGTFISKEKFELKKFECNVIYSNFAKIDKNSKILFEFKNGDSGENKVISQAKNYQLIAKILFKDEPFFHIIIVRSKKLGNLLKGKINRIEKKNFTNFAILCLDSNLKILGIDFTPNKDESKEGSKQKKRKVLKVIQKMKQLKQK